MPARVPVRRRSPAPIGESLRGLGERLRQARVEAGLSQAKLGAPHFTRAYVSALELGKIRPSMTSLEFLAAKLGKPVGFFVEDERREKARQERDMDVRAAAALLGRPSAHEALLRIHSLLETATDPEEIARLRLMAGTALNFLTESAKALPELVTAERLALQLGMREMLWRTRHQMAIAYRNVGEPKRSRHLLITILNEMDELNDADVVLRMKLLKDLGAVSWELGEHERASAYYESALASAEDVGDLAGLAGIYIGLAYARRAAGDLEAATSYLQRGLGASQASNDLAQAAILHNALAVLAAERGHVETAYKHADRAIELSRVGGPELYVAHYLNTKAECALKVGRTEESDRFAHEALALADRTSNHRAAAAARVVLAEVARRAGRRDEAVLRLEEAAAIYRSISARQELGEVLMRLSGIARDRGDLGLAQRYAEQAFESTKSPNALIRS